MVRLAAITLLAIAASPATARLCVPDAVPAATLLLPAFETDIGDADGVDRAECEGVDTLFTINNASASPALAHITLWTDWSWPSIDFDMFLTGYDMQSISLCRVIGRGELPVTSDEAHDPDDTVSPHGEKPWLDGSFPGCDGPPPFFPLPSQVPDSLLDRLQNAHAGFEIPGIGCTGEAKNGSGGQCSAGSCPPLTRAYGYVTIDSVNRCSTVFPNEVGYFVQGGQGIASNANQLWGDWFQIDPTRDFAQGDNLVHIEADASLGTGFGGPNSATGYTFYGRYFTALGGFTGADNREPLGTAWAARYLGPPFNGSTFVVWRDSTEDLVSTGTGYPCGRCVEGAGPDWCPLNETQVVCFDESENAVELCFSEGGGVISPPQDPDDPACFPLESNITWSNDPPLDPPFSFGWCYFNLNHDCESCFPGGAPWPPGGNGIAQSYVGVAHSAFGRFQVGLPSIELISACSTLSPSITGPQP